MFKAKCSPLFSLPEQVTVKTQARTENCKIKALTVVVYFPNLLKVCFPKEHCI